MKRYILIAGVNGAGKSTLYQALDYLQGMPRINIDEIVREFGDWKNPSDIAEAGRIAVGLRKDYFEKGISFNQETTLCGKSILENIKYAKQLGYEIELHYFCHYAMWQCYMIIQRVSIGLSFINPVVLRTYPRNNRIGIRR